VEVAIIPLLLLLLLLLWVLLHWLAHGWRFFLAAGAVAAHKTRSLSYEDRQARRGSGQ
jgi:hypothetical protein